MATPLPRSEFAASEKLVYLNHAATGVLPKSTRALVETFVREHAEGGVLGTYPYDLRTREYRESIGRFVGATGEQIAFLHSTSEGANVIAEGFDWQAGDEIVLSNDEFPANAIPWLALRDRGVVIRFIDTARERMTPDALRRAMTPRTRVVTVSWVSFADGYRHDVAALAQIAHEGGAFLCVDAIQGLGVFPIDVRATGVDALYANGAKWMLALHGSAFLYVRDALREHLRVTMPGWRTVADMWDFLNYDQPYIQEAARYEGGGTPNLIGNLSLAASVDFFGRHDIAAVTEHVLALTDHLVEGLRRAGAQITTVRGPGISSGIVTFTMSGTDPVALGRMLGRERIVTTYRSNGIRVSPHGYNTKAEIDHLLDVLKTYQRTAPSLA